MIVVCGEQKGNEEFVVYLMALSQHSLGMTEETQES
jgi:hypothetical protein